MKYSYDLHVHSCLSPCGDNDMTPNNMVNMAALLGCGILAVTDHNSCKNVPAAVKAGERAGVLVMPGMELCTSEEAHIVCLFSTVEGAMDFDSYVSKNTPEIANRPDIFGDQLIMDDNDEITGKVEKLLISSSFISVESVMELVRKYGGTAFPAHINKDSYSIVASLGVVPESAGFKAVEITSSCDIEKFRLTNPEIDNKMILTDSDAHYLESLTENMGWVDLPEKSRDALISLIGGNGTGEFSPFGAHI